MKKRSFRLASFVSLFIALLLPMQSVYAITTSASLSPADYIGQGIDHYDTSTPICGAGGGGGDSGILTIQSVHGKNNAEKIYNFWLDAGLAPQQAAGITGNMQAESGFSPFRQEASQSWPAGGWGIAQFTGGERDSATAYTSKAIGAIFTQYYQSTYGGPTTQSSGYVPSGVPVDVNDKFLLAELNYLLGVTKSFKPASNNIRTGWLMRDFGKSVDPSLNLFDYMKTQTSASDAAIAWVYLYEAPGDIKNTALARADYAKNILSVITGGGAGSGASVCGGEMPSGGMTLDQAKKFMDTYLMIDNGDPNGDFKYVSDTSFCHTHTDNCVTFSAYFIRKYTNIKFVSGNGRDVVGNTAAGNPGISTGTIPKPYAVFSIASGVTMCGSSPCGHTGVVLGVDQAAGKVVVGEAAYCDPGFTGAHEYPLSEWTDGRHTYLYTDGHLKGGLQ